MSATVLAQQHTFKAERAGGDWDASLRWRPIGSDGSNTLDSLPVLPSLLIFHFHSPPTFCLRCAALTALPFAPAASSPLALSSLSLPFGPRLAAARPIGNRYEIARCC